MGKAGPQEGEVGGRFGPVKNVFKASKTHERLVPILVKYLWPGLVRPGFATAFSWVRKHQKTPSILSSSPNKGVCLLGDFIPGNPRAKQPIKLLLPPGLEPCMHPALVLPTLSSSFALNLLPYKYLPCWESNKATGGLSFTQAPSSSPVG